MAQTEGISLADSNFPQIIVADGYLAGTGIVEIIVLFSVLRYVGDRKAKDKPRCQPVFFIGFS